MVWDGSQTFNDLKQMVKDPSISPAFDSGGSVSLRKRLDMEMVQMREYQKKFLEQMI